MVIRAIGEIDDPADSPADINRYDPHGDPVTAPIEIRSGV
jgi:hypothetical protein